jgi:hypothetical protein
VLPTNEEVGLGDDDDADERRDEVGRGRGGGRRGGVLRVGGQAVAVLVQQVDDYAVRPPEALLNVVLAASTRKADLYIHT